MKCQKCNFENDDKRIFCINCGERLNNEEVKQQSESPKSSMSLNEFMNSKEKKYKNNCLSQAWKDIRSNKSWFKKLILLGLCNIIPIINFASAGYALKWGCNISKDKNNKFPKEIINSDNIKLGFFEWVVWLAYGFIFICASLIIQSVFNNTFALLATVINIALFIFGYFWNTYVSLACVYMSKDNKIATSFAFAKIFKSYKENFPQIILSYFIPSIIFGAISLGFLVLLGLLFFSGQIQNAMLFDIANISNAINFSSIVYIFMMIVSLSIFILFAFVGTSFFIGIERIIRYRAMGYYFDRYCDKSQN